MRRSSPVHPRTAVRAILRFQLFVRKFLMVYSSPASRAIQPSVCAIVKHIPLSMHHLRNVGGWQFTNSPQLPFRGIKKIRVLQRCQRRFAADVFVSMVGLLIARGTHAVFQKRTRRVFPAAFARLFCPVNCPVRRNLPTPLTDRRHVHHVFTFCHPSCPPFPPSPARPPQCQKAPLSARSAYSGHVRTPSDGYSSDPVCTKSRF